MLIAACAVGCITKMPLEPREPTPGAPHFAVMTYNVHRGRSDAANTLATIGAADADIVCLQEVTEAWKRVIEQRYAAQYPVMLFAPKENAGGLAVLSKYPMEDRGVIPYSDDWHPAWHVIADTPGGPVQLMQVHLRSNFDGDSHAISNFFETSSDHVAELEYFMARTEPGIPTVVLGDFNESPEGDAVRWLEARGYRNALPLFRPGQFTFQARSVAAMFDLTLDHVMFDRSFEPLSASVSRGGGSDHLPVLARLELARAAAQP